MNVGKFKTNKKQKLSVAIQSFYSVLSYSAIQKIIRNKDVKVNGFRVSSDVVLNIDDEVVFYTKDKIEVVYDVLYDDENIIIVFKPRNIETVSEAEEVSLLTELEKQTSLTLHAVHRLDRNTEGLVVFAKNVESKNELDFAFKNRTLEKYYLALVYGVPLKESDQMVAYLKKDAKKAKVYVSDEQMVGYDTIQTNYKVILKNENSSVVEIELVTGKTHQIRAHFAHIGHFVIGDEKYGNADINKIFGKRKQCLVAYKIVFHFQKGTHLSYLDGKQIELKKEKIEFFK